MKYNDNGEWKDIIVKATDTLPIGTEVDYNGTDVPDGWEEVEDTVTRVLKVIYPVGAIYTSTNNTNPKDMFGFGTWERIQDKFLLCAGSTYEAGTTGGSASHTLRASEIPVFAFSTGHIAYGEGMAMGITNVTHTFESGQGSGVACYEGAKGDSTGYREKYTFGGGKAHNNMPPYLVVYAWKRTA